MKRETPPRPIIPDWHIGDQQLDQIEGACGVVMSVRQRAAVARALLDYHESVWISRQAPKPRDLKEILINIAELALGLRDALAELAAAPDGTAKDILVDGLPDGVTLPEARRSIAYIENTARRVAGGLAGKDGNPGTPHLAPLIRDLYGTYHAAAGGGRYSRAFLEMVKAALRLLGHRELRKTDKAIKKDIERSFKDLPPELSTK